MRQRVGIERSHDASQAQILDPAEDLADAQAATGPVALALSLDAADHDVGPEAPEVVAKGGDGAVGGDEEWQHVEALGAVIAHESGARARDGHDLSGYLRTTPRPSIHQGVAVRT